MTSKNRLEALSDGVIAIIITVMVFDLKLLFDLALCSQHYSGGGIGISVFSDICGHTHLVFFTGAAVQNLTL
jgi:hypothetical protein